MNLGIPVIRLLITGNMGYVGPVLCQHLRARFPDAELIGYDSGLFAHCLTTPGRLPETLLSTQHFGDTRDFSPALLEGVNAVVHLAAISNDPMGNRFGQATDAINRAATTRLAEHAAQAGVKAFVFASSCSVYGFAEGGPRREADELAPLTAYARSKTASEEGLRQAKVNGMAVTCLRFATACGMSPRLRLDLVLNDFVAGAVAGQEISILSDGTPWRPLIHVDDMARAIEWGILRQPQADDGFLIVNAGSDEWNYQIGELARAVAARVDAVTLSINADALPDKRSYRVDFSLFKHLAPNHQPQVSLQDAIDGLVDGLRAIGFSDRDFRQSERMRLRVISKLVDTGCLRPDLRWAGTA